MPVSSAFMYTVLLHRALEREEHEKSLICHFMEIWKIHDDSVRPTIDESQ